MWSTKSFNWEYTNTVIIIARGFQLLLLEQLSLYGQIPQGSALRVPERVLGLTPLAQGHAVKTRLGEVHETFADSRDDMAAEAFLHTLKG